MLVRCVVLMRLRVNEPFIDRGLGDWIGGFRSVQC